MTEKEWTDILRRRMADYEKPAPADLWNDIAHSLKKRPQKRFRLLPVIIESAAAAIAALLLCWPSDRPAIQDAPQRLSATAASQPREEEDTASPHTVTSRATPDVLTAEATTPALPKKHTATSAEDTHTTPDSAAAPLTARTPSENKEKPHGMKEPNHPRSSYDATPSGTSKRKRLSLRLMASNAATSSGSMEGYGSLTGRPIPSLSEDGESPASGAMTSILQTNKHQNLPTYTDTRHRQPVRLAFMADYEITPRLSLETGLTYTFLRSDMRSGSEQYFYRTKQLLHYIGLPVGLRYDFWESHRLRCYAAAGGMAELCVSGKAETDYIYDDGVTSTSNDDVRPASPQWSLYASAGIQFDLSSQWGIFAEPGISYHFDNGSAVQNFYKAHPLNFKLNFGIRFTLPSGND